MNAFGTRRRVRQAEFELQATERALDASWQTWRARLQRHRAAILVGGGLLGGLALATVSPKRWARVGALVLGGSARLARSPLLPALLGALLAGRHVSAPVERDAPAPRDADG